MWLDNQDEEKQNTNNQAGSSPSVGAGAGAAQPGQAPTGVVSNPSTQNPIQSNKPTQDFATVQDYLGANQQQGEDLGQKFNTNLSDTATKEKGAINTATAGAQNDITAGTASYDPNLTSTALSDPTKVANDPGQLQSFLKQWNASYAGPSSFENSTEYAPAATAANEAGQNIAQLNTVGGQQQLLKDQFGNTSQGGNQLDQAVLQNSAAYNGGNTAKAGFNSVNDYLNSQTNNLDTQAQQAQIASDKAKTDTQNAFTGNLGNFQNTINAKVAANQATATTQANTYKDALQSGDATKISAALQSSNLTDAQRANLTDYLTAINKDYGAHPDLTNFYTSNPATDINAANSASAQDYQNAAAYGKLTGVDYSGVLNPADAAKAGQIPSPNTGIDATGANTALRQYLVQKQQEANQPQTAGSVGQSPNAPSNTNKLLTGAAGLFPTTVIPTAGIIGGIQKAGNSIANHLGIGGGKGDAQVTLPALNLPPMAVPATANAATTKAITDVYSKPLAAGGSYQENAIGDMVGRLGVFKDALAKGQISKDEYNAYVQPLAKWAYQGMDVLSRASSQAYNSIKPAYAQLMAGNYLTPIQ